MKASPEMKKANYRDTNNILRCAICAHYDTTMNYDGHIRHSCGLFDSLIFDGFVEQRRIYDHAACQRKQECTGCIGIRDRDNRRCRKI